MRNTFLLLIFSVILISCSASVPKYSPVKTQDEMLSNYDEFCRHMDNFYPYFDITEFNWDSLKSYHRDKIRSITTEADFVKNIRQMLSAFNDPHCNIISPDDQSLFSKLLYPAEGKSFQLIFEEILADHATFPFRFRIVENNPVISFIDSSSNEFNLGLRAGMMLKSINGKSLDDYVKENCIYSYRPETRLSALVNNNLLIGEKGQKISLSFSSAGGKEIKTECEYRPEYNKYLFNQSAVKYLTSYKKLQTLEYGLLKNNIGYISIPSFLGVEARRRKGRLFFWVFDGKESPNVKDFEKALKELETTNGLVIDVRDNRGGNGSIGRVMTKYLLSGDIPLYPYCWRDGEYPKDIRKYTRIFCDTISTLERSHQLKDYRLYNGQYLKPVVVLQNEGCVSSTEDFLAGLRNIPAVTTLGVNSAGSSSDPIFFRLPNGLFARVPGRRTYYQEGRLIEKEGIPPDITAKLTIDDLSHERDSQLEKAVELLQNKFSENVK